MKLDKSDFPNIISTLDNIAKENTYTKICAKIPYSLKGEFIKSGYIVEATIPRFYNCVEDVIFISKYFSEERALIKDCNEIKKVIAISCEKDKIKKHLIVKVDVVCVIYHVVVFVRHQLFICDKHN